MIELQSIEAFRREIKRNKEMGKHFWIFLAVIATIYAAVVWSFHAHAQDSQRRRIVITDLPPAAATSPQVVTDIFVDAAPIGITILRVCQQYRASCAVAGDSAAVVGYTCNGSTSICWRQFVAALSEAGIGVLVSPAIGGASYSFHLRGSTAPDIAPEN